jgi:hypothetical protein
MGRNKGTIMNQPNWIKIRCLCGKEANYLPTVSGKTPCDGIGCHKLLNVPRLIENPETGTGITTEDIDEILGRR